MKVLLTLLLGAIIPATAEALQLGGTIDFGTGPAVWDQLDSRDPLLDAALGANYQMPRILGLRPELLGDFGLSSRPGEPAAVSWDFGARLHTSGTVGGVWLGAAVGAAGTRNIRSELTRLEAGIRRSLGPAHINVWLSRTGFGAGVAPHGALGQDSAGSPDTVARKGVTEYTDLASQVTLGLSRYELGLSLTRRLGSAAVRRTGWELSATWWMTPEIGVVGAAGHSLPQFGFTVPSARYGTVGLRLAVGARSPTDRSREKPATEVTPSAGPTVVVADRRLTILSAPALRAEVMGDFTDWKVEPFIATGAGRWRLPIALSPGVYHLNVRFDGGAWLVPLGAVAVDDGFGGSVGMVVVR
jgi:hypothetical protein